MAIPQLWDEALAQWDGAGNLWDPPPPSALFAGALLGTGVLDGVLVLGVVALEGQLRGTAVVAGPLRTGIFFGGDLDGTGTLAAATLQTGTRFSGDLRGTGLFTGAFYIPPAGALFAGELRGIGLLSGFLPGVALTLPRQFGPASPYAETPWLDENFAAILAQINRPQALGIGLLAERPAPGRQGSIYVVTDQNDEWWVDDGVAWRSMGAFGFGMVVHEQATDNLLLLGAPTGPPTASHVLTAAKASVIPTQAIVDGAVLYVANRQGLAGTAAWHHLTEAGRRTPLEPVLFRYGFQGFASTTTEQTLFGPFLKGGTLVGRYLEVWWRGDASNGTAVPHTLTLRFYYAGTALVVTTLTIPVGSFQPLSVLLRIDGLLGAVQAALPVSVVAPGAVSHVLTPGAVDATVDQGSGLSAAWDVADAALTLRTFAATVTLR